MARRHEWLHCGAGLTACLLVAGCLTHPTERQPLFTPIAPPPAAEPPTARLQAQGFVEIHSPYSPRSDGIRVAGAFESIPVVDKVDIMPIPPAEAILLGKEPDKPSPPRPPESTPVKESSLLAAFRCILEKNSEEAMALLDKYGKSDRQKLLALLRLTADVSTGELSPREAEELLDQLQELIAQLRRRAPLVLGRVCFCQKIEGFGQYLALPPGYPFQAGCDCRPGDRVQVYAEVRNFSSRLEGGQFKTWLSTSLEILKAGGGTTPEEIQRRKVVMMNLGSCIDYSSTARQDYYLNFQFHVPARLPPGLYTLWVTVKDATPGPGSARVARRSLDFTVCPPGARPRP
jgi:hypothetical protein